MHGIQSVPRGRTWKCTVAAQKHHASTVVSSRPLHFTQNHEAYMQGLKNKATPLVVGVGPAGCGKTLLPCYEAMHSLAKGEIQKIVLTRPAVSAEEEHGFLPGDLQQKMSPWLVPIYDAFKQVVTPTRLRDYIANEEVEICPLSFIRGRTFHDCWVIADEVQNTTPNQMKTLLTRLGQNSKMVLTGDLTQCDLKQSPNGLEDFLERLMASSGEEKNELVKVVMFDESDVMRSEIVKFLLQVYA